MPLPIVPSSQGTPEEAGAQTDRLLAQGRSSVVPLSTLSPSLSALTCAMGRITRGRLCKVEGRRLFVSRWRRLHLVLLGRSRVRGCPRPASSPGVKSGRSARAVARRFCPGRARCPARDCVSAVLPASSLLHLTVLSSGVSLAAFIQLVTDSGRACCPQGVKQLIDRGHFLGPSEADGLF